MSKKNKVKNIKNMVSSLDIYKLYKLQEYVSTSQEFFNELDLLVVESICSDEEDSIYIFYDKFISLYDSIRVKLNVK